jgi:hypothetical protein
MLEEEAAREGAEDEVVTEAEETPEVEEEIPATDEEAEAEETDDEEVEYDLGGGQKVKFAANATAKEVFETAQAALKTVEGNFTKKQMAHADQVKALEAEKQAVEKLRNLNGDALEQYSRGLGVKQELEQLQGINLSAMWQSNPDQARRVSDRISQKQVEFQRIVAKVSEIEAEQSKAEQEFFSRRLEEGRAEVERRIPGFAEKHANDVMAYAVSQGIPEGEAGKWAANPVVTSMAFKAMLYDRLAEKATKATSKPKVEAKPVQTTRTTGGRKPALDLVKDADRMSTDAWLAQRRKQLAG